MAYDVKAYITLYNVVSFTGLWEHYSDLEVQGSERTHGIGRRLLLIPNPFNIQRPTAAWERCHLEKGSISRDTCVPGAVSSAANGGQQEEVRDGQ